MSKAKKKTVKKAAKQATRKPAAKKSAKKSAASSKKLDGDKLVALLGAPWDDERFAAILHQVGYTKGLQGDEIPLRKHGVALLFERERDGKRVLSQIQFELRRGWTGFKKYEGRLPYGISPDLKTVDRANVLADRATRIEDSEDWYSYYLPEHEIAMGFGKTFVETVFVIAPDA